MTATQRPVFGGFSLPAGAWLPPELIDLLPDIHSVGELKVTILAIFATMKVAGSEAVIPLGDFERLGGMTRKTVLAGIRRAVEERGTIERRQVANTHAYRLTLCDATRRTVHSDTARGRETPPPEGGQLPLMSGESPPISRETPPISGEVPLRACMHDSSSHIQSSLERENHAEPLDSGEAPLESGETTPLGEPSDDPTEKRTLVRRMHEQGVTVRVAEDIASRYAPVYIVEKLRHLMHQIDKGVVRKPAGYFVASIKKDFVEPDGFDPYRWFDSEEEREEYIRTKYTTGKYAGLIKH